VGCTVVTLGQYFGKARLSKCCSLFLWPFFRAFLQKERAASNLNYKDGEEIKERGAAS
jgi:hypothetical protein